MNQTRLKNIYFYIKEREADFDMAEVKKDFAYYAACVAVGDDLHGKQVTQYRGQETHTHEIVAAFLQATEAEVDQLIFLGRWPDIAYHLYRKGQRLRGLLFAVNQFIDGE